MQLPSLIHLPAVPRVLTASRESIPPSLNPNRRRFSLRDTRGMSLIEIMVALGLLAFLSVSVMSVTFQIRSMAEQAVYQNTGLTLAQGYMEQIRHLDYPDLRGAAQSGTAALPLYRTDGTAVVPDAGGTFCKGMWASETIYLDQSASGAKTQPMTFKFQVLLNSLETITSGTANPATGTEVSIDYTITYNYGVTRTTHSILRSVRSAVPLY